MFTAGKSAFTAFQGWPAIRAAGTGMFTTDHVSSGMSAVKIVLFVLLAAPLASALFGCMMVAGLVGGTIGGAATSAVGQRQPAHEAPQSPTGGSPKVDPALTWQRAMASGLTATHVIEANIRDMRIDRWNYGFPAHGGPFSSITFVQGDDRRFHGNGFATEVFRAVRVNGSLRISGPHYRFTTRFGAFNGRDVIIDDGTRPRTCIAFVSAFDLPYAIVAGFHCAPAGRAAEPLPVACMIDAISFQRRELRAGLASLADQSEHGVSTCATQSFHETPRRERGVTIRIN